jgi:hypothetical protein
LGGHNEGSEARLSLPEQTTSVTGELANPNDSLPTDPAHASGELAVPEQPNGFDDDRRAIDLPRWTSTSYTLMLRSDADAGVGAIVAQAEKCRDHGFINYSSVLRHGAPITESLGFAKSLLAEQFPLCVARYARTLSGTDALLRTEMNNLCKRVRAQYSTDDAEVDMRNFRRDLRDLHVFATDRIGTLKREMPPMSHTTLSGSDTALCGELAAFLKHAVEANADCRRILEEVVPEQCLRDHLRTASDVMFNSLASLRLKHHGRRVVPGDVVALDKTMLWDRLEPPTFAVQTSREAELDVEEVERPELTEETAAALHVVASEKEAAEFCITDIVLPKFGFAPHLIQANEAEGDGPLRGDIDIEAALESFPALPTLDRVNGNAMAVMVRVMKLQRLLTHPLAPSPTYRRLVAKPTSLSVCGWDDKLNVRIGDVQPGTRNMAIETFIDGDGVRRLAPELWLPAGMSTVHRARPAIRGMSAREAFLSTAKQRSCVALRVTLPAGVALTSLLRECVGLELPAAQDIGRLTTAAGHATEVAKRRRSYFRAKSQKGRDEFRAMRELDSQNSD